MQALDLPAAGCRCHCRRYPLPLPCPSTPRSPSPLPLPGKPTSRLLSFFLRAAIMILVTACFFLFVGFAAVLLLLVHLCIANGAPLPLRRRRLQSGADGPDPTGYSREDLRKLPSIRHAAAVPGSGGECAVCLSDFEGGEWCRLLPGCGHRFHAGCIDRWLVKAPCCPICRRRVRFTGGVGLIETAAELRRRLRCTDGG